MSETSVDSSPDLDRTQVAAGYAVAATAILNTQVCAMIAATGCFMFGWLAIDLIGLLAAAFATFFMVALSVSIQIPIRIKGNAEANVVLRDAGKYFGVNIILMILIAAVLWFVTKIFGPDAQVLFMGLSIVALELVLMVGMWQYCINQREKYRSGKWAEYE